MRFENSTSNEHKWNGFGDTSVLRSWSEELKNINVSQRCTNLWRLIGRAVMVVHPGPSLYRKLIELIAREAGYEFSEMDGAEFVHLILSGKSPINVTPSLVYVKHGDWSKKYGDDEQIPSEIAESRTKIGDYFARLDPEMKVVFVTAGESYDELDSSLRKAGNFDRRFIVPRLTLGQIGDSFLNLIGKDLCGTSLLGNPGKVGKLIYEEFDDERRQGLVALAMERISFRERRKVEFTDLVQLAIHGSGERKLTPEEDASMLYRVAVHEAGHALICMLDSNHQNIPDYISVLPGIQFRGVVADSYEFMECLHGKYTYEDSRHKIRSTLAGRAAEAVVFGSTKVGTFGARADLVNASNWAKELVGACGFPVDIDTSNSIGGNLLVTDSDPSETEQSHTESMARQYLKIQYEHVEKVLQENRGLLDLITRELLAHPVLSQKDLERLMGLSSPIRCEVDAELLDFNSA